MANKSESILYQVAFKAAVELVKEGILELESDDYAAEIFALTDPLYDGLIVKAGEDTGKSSRSSSGGSKKRSSNRSGSKRNDDIKIKDPDAEATPAQKRKLRSLLKDAGESIDDYGFDDLDDLTKQEASDLIGELL